MRREMGSERACSGVRHAAAANFREGDSGSSFGVPASRMRVEVLAFLAGRWLAVGWAVHSMSARRSHMLHDAPYI
jgi:hypothetical protein